MSFTHRCTCPLVRRAPRTAGRQATRSPPPSLCTNPPFLPPHRLALSQLRGGPRVAGGSGRLPRAPRTEVPRECASVTVTQPRAFSVRPDPIYLPRGGSAGSLASSLSLWLVQAGRAGAEPVLPRETPDRRGHVSALASATSAPGPDDLAPPVLRPFGDSGERVARGASRAADRGSGISREPWAPARSRPMGVTRVGFWVLPWGTGERGDDVAVTVKSRPPRGEMQRPPVAWARRAKQERAARCGLGRGRVREPGRRTRAWAAFRCDPSSPKCPLPAFPPFTLPLGHRRLFLMLGSFVCNLNLFPRFSRTYAKC